MKDFTSAIDCSTITVNMEKVAYIQEYDHKDSMWIHLDSGEKILVKKEGLI